MVKIQIDGKTIQAKDGAMIIEVADEAGIPIPRFCYHKHLSIAANCRMCLVEVDTQKKPMPACATPVTEGMRIYTRSPRAVDAQRGTMEFLLINHPLDCPICDQGGECDLQELSIGYGQDVSRYAESKRVIADQDLGTLIATDMTRCIHCTRCVRFGQEVAGLMELGATGRGEHMQIGTYVEQAMDSEVSGNVIDLCPVGALTSKPYRYTARPWELRDHSGVAPHDCLGSNVQIQVRGHEVMRVLPRENGDINLTWLSDRDRFSYQGLHGARLTVPMIRRDGQWHETDWQTALEHTVKGLRAVMMRGGGGQIGTLVSPSATLEELYLLQKLVRGLGSPHIDHRLRQLDFGDQDLAPAYPTLGRRIRDLDDVDAALLIGSNLRKDQPLAALRLRRAALKGGRVMVLNSVDHDLNFPVYARLIADPARLEAELAAVAAALLEITGLTPPQGFAALVSDVDVGARHRDVAKRLHASKRGVVLLGTQASMHPALATLRALAGLIASCCSARLGYLTDGANAAGAWLAGAVPHRGPAGTAVSAPGLHARAMLEEQPRQGYILFNLEPEYDTANPARALTALRAAQFVAVMTPYKTDEMLSYADVLLPVAAFSETSGTYVNADGLWQGFAGAAPPPGDARPGWKLLRVLGNLFAVTGFEQMSSEDARDELRAAVEAAKLKPDNAVAWRCPRRLSPRGAGLVRVTQLPLYAVDALVRRATALQEVADARQAFFSINAALAQRLGLADGQPAVAAAGEAEAVLPVRIDPRVSDECVLIPVGLPGTRGLDAAALHITLRPAAAPAAAPPLKRPAGERAL